MGFFLTLKRCIQTLFKTNDEKLRRAAFYGDAVQLKRLIPISDPKLYDSAALMYAAEQGYVECVKLLMPVSDPTVALWVAARYGWTDDLKRFIQNSNPSSHGNKALELAAENGHTECVKLLIPVSDIAHSRNKWVLLIDCFGRELHTLALHTLDQAEAELVLAKRDNLANAIGMDALEEQAPVTKRKI